MPLNVKWIFEGEEESGLRSTLPQVFGRITATLLAADVAVVSDTALCSGRAFPPSPTACAGLAYVEVMLRRTRTGTFTPVCMAAPLRTPSMRWLKMIADLHDEDHRVTIDGFYDDAVMPLTAEERTTFASLPFDADEWVARCGRF